MCHYFFLSIYSKPVEKQDYVLYNINHINISIPKNNKFEFQDKAVINLSFSLSKNGEMIIINVPALTEERRIQLVKQVKSETESRRTSR